MTVRELVDRLESLDADDSKVVIDTRDGGYHSIPGVLSVTEHEVGEDLTPLGMLDSETDETEWVVSITI